MLSVKVPELNLTLKFHPIGKFYLCKNVLFLTKPVKKVLISTLKAGAGIEKLIIPGEEGHMVSDEVTGFSSDASQRGISGSKDIHLSDQKPIRTNKKLVSPSADRKKVQIGVNNDRVMTSDSQLHQNATSSNSNHMDRERISDMTNVERDIMVSTPSFVKILDKEVSSQRRNMNVRSTDFRGQDLTGLSQSKATTSIGW